MKNNTWRKFNFKALPKYKCGDCQQNCYGKDFKIRNRLCNKCYSARNKVSCKLYRERKKDELNEK